MPKIKLSSLVSDIKGKANGSVFARNKGGLYYRNNPSGGGRKTEKWAKAKATFSAMAGKWRDLDQEQQTAWNNAVANYNAKDAFGDDRIPSGYELFIRLNQPLFNLGGDINLLPPAPQSMPSIGAAYLLTPEEFLFTPFTGYAPYNCQADDPWLNDDIIGCNDPNADLNDGCVLYIDEPFIANLVTYDPLLPLTFSSAYVFSEKVILQNGSLFFIPLTSSESADSNVIVTIESLDKINWYVNIQVAGPNSVSSVEAELASLNFDEPWNLTWSFDVNDPEAFFVYINGEIHANRNLRNDLDKNEPFLLDMEFQPKSDGEYSPLLIRSFFLSNESVDESYLGLLVKGYVVGNPLFYFIFEYNPSGKFKNYGSVKIPAINRMPVMNNPKKSFVARNWEVAPFLAITTEEVLPPGFLLVLKTSPMGSTGRIGNRSGFKRVGTFAMDSNSYKDIGSEFLNEFGAIINNSFIQVTYAILNVATGQLSADTKIEFGYSQEILGPIAPRLCDVNDACPPGYTCINGLCIKELEPSATEKKKKKKVVKFKAGSEMASSVN